MPDPRFRVNGTEATFNELSIELSNNQGYKYAIVSGLEEFNWSDSCEGGSFEGQSPYQEDETTGDIKGEGSLVMKQSTWAKQVAAKLGPRGGVYGVSWNAVLVYTDKEGIVHNTVITGCRFKTRKGDGKRGSDPLKRSADFKITGKVYEEGYGPLGEPMGT
jgi:hypothetical protein